MNKSNRATAALIASAAANSLLRPFTKRFGEELVDQSHPWASPGKCPELMERLAGEPFALTADKLCSATSVARQGLVAIRELLAGRN